MVGLLSRRWKRSLSDGPRQLQELTRSDPDMERLMAQVARFVLRLAQNREREARGSLALGLVPLLASSVGAVTAEVRRLSAAFPSHVVCACRPCSPAREHAYSSSLGHLG